MLRGYLTNFHACTCRVALKLQDDMLVIASCTEALDSLPAGSASGADSMSAPRAAALFLRGSALLRQRQLREAKVLCVTCVNMVVFYVVCGELPF